MADIYEYIKKSNNSRPVYTGYELSKMVKEKREGSGLDRADFAAEYGISEKILTEIETGACAFSPKFFKTCGSLLGFSNEELLAEICDDERTVNFRVSGEPDGVLDTFEKANMLFQEIIMQNKIGVR